MAEVTVSCHGDGEVVFAVSWTEPMRSEFGSRLEAERFAAWLRATGMTVEVDGSCQACQAHHASGHDCPSCGAHLGLRMRPEPGQRLTRPSVPIPAPFAVAREQARIRVELAERKQQEWVDEMRRADAEAAAEAISA